jgi:hypothetical protein
MPYMLMIMEPPRQRDERGPEVGKQAYTDMVAFAGQLKKRGVLLGVESLASDRKATRVTVRGGRSSMVDGPYAEAKEMIGGFFMLNCKTREEALAIAAECPAASWCTIEVRETGPCWE